LVGGATPKEDSGPAPSMMYRLSFCPGVVVLLVASQVLVVTAEDAEAGLSAGLLGTSASPRTASTYVSASSQQASLRGSRALPGQNGRDARENSSETWVSSPNVTTPADNTEAESREAEEVLVVTAEDGEAGLLAGAEPTNVSASVQRQFESLRGSRTPPQPEAPWENSSETWVASSNVTSPADVMEVASIVAEEDIEKQVYCICRKAPKEYQCGRMYYTVMQCDRSCRSVCSGMHLKMQSCDGYRSVHWIDRLQWQWTPCPDAPEPDHLPERWR